MIKKLTEFLDYALFAELALVIFAVVFIAVVIRTLRINKDVTDRQSRIVLGDQHETVRETR